MSYFRRRFSSFEEFQREAFFEGDELGKDEIELLQELEAEEDLFDVITRRRRRAPWD